MTARTDARLGMTVHDDPSAVLPLLADAVSVEARQTDPETVEVWIERHAGRPGGPLRRTLILCTPDVARQARVLAVQMAAGKGAES